MRPMSVLGMILLAASGLLALAQEGGSPYETIIKEMIAATDQISSVLVTIKDGDTAAEAKPGLKKAAELFVEVRKKAEALKQPDQQERDRVGREYRKKLDTSLTRLGEEMKRVRAIAGGREALQELSSLDDQPKENPGKEDKK